MLYVYDGNIPVSGKSDMMTVATFRTAKNSNVRVAFRGRGVCSGRLASLAEQIQGDSMSKVLAIILAVCAGVTGVTAVPSFAAAEDTPAICNTAREVRFFVLGVRKGRNLAESAIARVGGDDACDDLSALDELRDLIAAIVEDVVVPVGASEITQCHVLGQVAGLLGAVEDLQEICGDVCIADGEFIGQISAFLYCELSIALDGLVPVELFTRLATDACGVRFQVACDNSFEETTTGDLECLPFTEGIHTEVFLEVQNNQCADNPDEDP